MLKRNRNPLQVKKETPWVADAVLVEGLMIPPDSIFGLSPEIPIPSYTFSRDNIGSF